MIETPVDFYSLSRSELAALLADRFGAPKFRADQLFQWVYKRRQREFSSMSNIGKELRAGLAEGFSFPSADMRRRELSSDGTRKYLFALEGADLVETVMIKQPTRMTLCVSSQVGCGMACGFCRTGTMGFRRHLSSSEIVRQVLGVIEDAANFGDMFQNIVFMGMGEPFHNFENVARAISILTDQHGFDISSRKITVSTVGLVPMIERFFSEGVKANLAVSLNATTDEVRSSIMPVNKAYPIEVLLGTLRRAPLKPRQRITIEYVMLAGVNDTKDDMRRLVRLLDGIPSKVNLIPYNTNAGLGFDTPSRETVSAWRNYILSKGMNVTVRWSKGQDINAACGQLVTESVRAARKRRPPELVSVAGPAE